MSNKKKPEEKTILKVILVGNAGVGKTAIINRFYKNSFTENMLPTIAMNYIEKKNNNRRAKNIFKYLGYSRPRRV